ncbi:MAG: hypothetical protein GY772_22260, partial [bacterium]|nr:hypothetical protein [bacterium]
LDATRVEDWASSLGGEALEVECLRAAFFARLGAVAAAFPVVDSGTLLLQRRGAAVTVTAAAAIPTGTLLLFPLVASTQSLVPDSQHPGRVATGVSTPRGHLYLNPCLRYPAGTGRPHAAGSTEVLGFMPPFWAIRRSQTEAEANCLFGTLPVELVTSIAAGEKPLQLPEPRFMSHESSTVPMLYNRASLEPGQELVVHKAVPKATSQKSARPRTWLEGEQQTQVRRLAEKVPRS